MKDRINKKQGFTFIEVCMSVLILSLVFGVAMYVIRYARKETQKGLWLQKSIEMLRNATKQIAIKLKEKNYPSTIVYKKKGIVDGKEVYESKVISYKEKREYDKGGRLRKIILNKAEQKPWYEVFITANNTTTPSNNNSDLMYLPVCSPETDYPSKGEVHNGKIVWTRFVLEPSPDYKVTRLGQIVMLEYEGEYQTSKADRAFELDDPKVYETFFTKKEKRRKVIVEDVSKVEIGNHDLSIYGGRGIAKSKDGDTPQAADLVKNVVVFKIYCRHPKDDKTELSDMCAITTSSEVLSTL